MCAGKDVAGQQPQQYGHTEDAADRNVVGQIHRAAVPTPRLSASPSGKATNQFTTETRKHGEHQKNNVAADSRQMNAHQY